MMPLTEDEKGRLESLAKQKELVFALKKVFLNTVTKGSVMTKDTQWLAAERIAIDLIKDAFHQLENLRPDTNISSNSKNMV